jgi:ribosomal protein L37AE/L43A
MTFPVRTNKQEMYEYVKDELQKYPDKKLNEICEEATQLFDLGARGIELYYYQMKKLDPEPIERLKTSKGLTDHQEIYDLVQKIHNDEGLGVSDAIKKVAEMRSMKEKDTTYRYYYWKKKVDPAEPRKKKVDIKQIIVGEECEMCGAKLVDNIPLGIKECPNEACDYKYAIPGFTPPPELSGEVEEKKPRQTIETSHILTVIGKIAQMNDVVNVEQVFRGLYPLFKLASEAAENKHIIANMQKIMADNEVLKASEAKAREEMAGMQERYQDIQKQFVALNNMVEDFLKKPALKKLADFEEDTYQLKVYIDGTGVVHRTML